MKRHARLVALAAIGLLAGCSSTVEGVCETIQEECSPPINGNTCVRDGLELEEVAENVECENSFEEHLDCLDEAVCDWETACDRTLEELLECLTGIRPAP